MTHIDPDDPAYHLATLAVHAGQSPDPLAGAAMPPIYQTSTYIQDGLGRPHNGFEYARTRNPTREALEGNLAALEGGTHGFAFGSGLAALDTLLKLLSAGDHVVVGNNIYGGSHRLMERVYERFGLAFTFVDMRDVTKVEAALRPTTKMIYCETPTNPMMFLADLTAIGDIAQAMGLLFAVDNTFATPMLQRPLTLGADVVLHSTTPSTSMVTRIWWAGHSSPVATISPERIGFLQNAAGGDARPDGLLARAARHQDVAAQDARALRERDDHCHVARRPERHQEGVFPWPAGSSAACARQAPDVGVWRHDLARARQRGPCPQGGRSDESLALTRNRWAAWSL